MSLSDMLSRKAKTGIPGHPPASPDAAHEPVSRFADTDVVDVEARPAEPAVAEPIPVESTGTPAAAKKAASRFRLGLNAKAPADAKATGVFEAPIHLILGYLPEVTERDALEYAMGMADKHITQPGLSYVGTFAYADGFVYELQEGGAGRAVTPAVLQYFASHGPWVAGETLRVVLPTASRKVEITRTRTGLEAVLLPESAEDQVTELRPTGKLTSLVPRRERMFWAGAALLMSGLVALVASGTYFRLQGYSAPPKQAYDQISIEALPHLQYSRLEAAQSEGTPIGALRYENKQWTLVAAQKPGPASPAAPAAPLPKGAEQ